MVLMNDDQALCHQDEGFRAVKAMEKVHLQESGREAEVVVPKQE